MKTVSVGIIGAGFSANLHAQGLNKVHGVEVKIAAVTATIPQSARNFAVRHHIPTTYASYRELLADPSIDVVCVCVPNALDATIVIEAAKAGKHVICEKPLTGAFGDGGGLTGVARANAELERALSSLSEIAKAVENSGVLFMYAENWIYPPSMTKIKKLLELSAGSILDIRAEESHSGSHALRSRRRETAGGGALLMLGSHPIGAAIHLKNHEAQLSGKEPFQVSAVTAEVAPLYKTTAVAKASTHNWVVSDWRDVETWANVVLSFTDGTKAVITASFAMLGGVRNSLEVYTTNAAFRSSMTANDELRVFSPDQEAFGTEYLHEKIESRTGWISAAPDEDWTRGYPQEMQDFMESVTELRPPLSDLSLARNVVEIIYASYVSAEEGRRVGLDLH